jgi:hypothetical protein
LRADTGDLFATVGAPGRRHRDDQNLERKRWTSVWVSPSCPSSGGARRLERSGWSLDGLLDDRQRCAAARDGEIGRRPEVSAHAGADTGAGVFTPYRVSGKAFESLDECGDRECGWVGDGFTVELRPVRRRPGARSAHGVGEHRSPVCGQEHQMRVQQRHAMAGGRYVWVVIGEP